jgi:hypothetical protein
LRQLWDIELLQNDEFPPLQGFPSQADYLFVCHPANSTLFEKEEYLGQTSVYSQVLFNLGMPKTMKRLEPFSITSLNKVVNKIYQSSFILKKEIYQRCIIQKSPEKKILFIIGCQRSGTTLMQSLFENDINSKVYGERSKLSSNDLENHLRLNSLDSIKKEINGDSAPLIVIRPLVETQNILKLLDYFQNSKAVFMYRYYKDVANSNIKYFGLQNGVNDLRPIVQNILGNWRSENIPEDVRKIVRKHFSEEMNPYDAAALFWFVRNSLFFSLRLAEHPDVILCRYEDLIQVPAEIIGSLYRFIDRTFQGQKTVEEVHSLALGKGRDLKLSSEIEDICNELLNKLDSVHKESHFQALASNPILAGGK